MDYHDAVYGPVEITEPVICDLMASRALQRLKDIDQSGYYEPHFPGISYSRFVHSVGVYLLLKKYNASLEEQIAGLIHDVSHSVFSHCIDYALDVGSQKEQNHQDNIFTAFVKKTDVSDIVSRFGFDLEYLLNDVHFPLKEAPLPDLCADRIDYSLRTAVTIREITDQEARAILTTLTVSDNRWVFQDLPSAQRYAELFLKLNTRYYASLSSAVMLWTVGDYLRHALDRGYINTDDLYTTDKLVLEKLTPFHASDERLQLLFDRMNCRIGFKNNPIDYDAEVYCKSRVVDPLCRINGVIKKISDVDPAWAAIIERESQPKCYYITFNR